jgi:hypothetical protein
MPKFVEAQRGYINLDLVAFMFRKDSGDFTCYSAEGNEIGTVDGSTVKQLLPTSTQTQRDLSHDEEEMAANRARIIAKLSR